MGIARAEPILRLTRIYLSMLTLSIVFLTVQLPLGMIRRRSEEDDLNANHQQPAGDIQ